MNNIKKLKTAQKYLNMLANGIDPITGERLPEDDTANNVHLSRCFFYVSEVLKQVEKDPQGLGLSVDTDGSSSAADTGHEYDQVDDVDLESEQASQDIDDILNANKKYFDNILKDIDPTIKLDGDQQRAIVHDGDHCLLVAGAGAGKTTTMAAKVKYLVDKKGVMPEEIIVISYTNKAIDELKERINDALGIPVKITTFHAFGFDIVKQFTDEIPQVNYSSYNIVYEMLEKQIYKNKKLMRNLVLFLGYYFDIPEDVFKYENLDQYHNYKASQTLETLRSGLNEFNQNIIDGRSRKQVTITGEYLRSVQEVQIANFLYLNNIDYQYEKIYEHQMPQFRKKYTPDFYLSQRDNEAYLEHYGISQTGHNALFSDKDRKKYSRSITDKRKLHKMHGTTLLETWSHYSDGKPLLEHLEQTLTENGFTLSPKSPKEVYIKIVETAKDKYVTKLVIFMMKFIELFKTSGYGEKDFTKLKRKTRNVRSKLFLDVVREVYRHYQKTLAQNNQIDFADMINNAYEYLVQIEEEGMSLPYKYIIIDEFQDIARQRFNLTKKLSEITDARVVAVGDDWQSIFAFSGADITLFTKFVELMESGEEMKITRTYRNSQELIDIAGKFIQKNSKQIKKKLISPKHLDDPIVLVPYDDGRGVMRNLAAAATETIGRIEGENPPGSSILLVGRYGFDMKNLCRTGQFEHISGNKFRCMKYPDANIEFLTAHSSKGLGYDNVILINMQEGKFGFPCQIEDDPIMKLVTTEDNAVPFAEERRLFYVALTRTKNRIYIAAPINKPSRFLQELVKEFDLPHPVEMNMGVVERNDLRCPMCNYPLKYEYNKNYGLHLYMCTNEVEVCDFMTNNRNHRYDIFKCAECDDGHMIVKTNRKNNDVFYGCTNFESAEVNCKNTKPILRGQKKQNM